MATLKEQEIQKFYRHTMVEVTSETNNLEEGGSQEQTFTLQMMNLLQEIGDSANVRVAFDERGIGTARQLRINGFGFADEYQNVDIFITLFRNDIDNIPHFLKADITTAAKRASNFFSAAFNGDYADRIEESAETYDFSQLLAHDTELRENLERVNVYILCNGFYDSEQPEKTTVKSEYRDEINVYYKVLDIRQLYEINLNSQSDIFLDLEELGYRVQCMKVNLTKDTNYDSYLAVMPGNLMADLYERYGTRLMQQNVRTFLQLTGKVNKGMRDTIVSSPDMFFAYNNGIAATAEAVELDSRGYLKSLKNFQIVNGGQTTASLFHTKTLKRKRGEDSISLDDIFVQMKLCVVKVKDKYSDIVSSISKYANTQNKVSDADLSANNEILVTIESVCKNLLTPASENKPTRSIWYFDRSRNQYKNQRIKEGKTTSLLNKFDALYPKGQVFTKTDLAKYANAYCEEGRFKRGGEQVQPWIVCKGSEKNYAEFITKNKPSKPGDVTQSYVKDLLAKAILFKTCEQLYSLGLTGKRSEKIGDLRNACVPYAIALVGYMTRYRLNLRKIWNEQALSPVLCKFLYNLMIEIDEFIRKDSDANKQTNYTEWAKKPACWENMKVNRWKSDFGSIEDELEDIDIIKAHWAEPDEIMGSIPVDLNVSDCDKVSWQTWYKIEQWGKDTRSLDFRQSSIAHSLCELKKQKRALTPDQQKLAAILYSFVLEKSPELLAEESEEETMTQKEEIISIDHVDEMLRWPSVKYVLDESEFEKLQRISKKLVDLESEGQFIMDCFLKLSLEGFGFADDTVENDSSFVPQGLDYTNIKEVTSRKAKIHLREPLKATEITTEIIKRMYYWHRTATILEDWKVTLMEKLIEGEKDLTYKIKWGMFENYKVLTEYGFKLND